MINRFIKRSQVVRRSQTCNDGTGESLWQCIGSPKNCLLVVRMEQPIRTAVVNLGKIKRLSNNGKLVVEEYELGKSKRRVGDVDRLSVGLEEVLQPS